MSVVYKVLGIPLCLYKLPPLLLLRFLLLPAICMYLHDFYDVHILCSDCMVMQKKASLSSAITQPTESYLDIIWKGGKKNCSFIYFNYELIRWDVHKYQTHPLVHPWLEWRVLGVGVGKKRDEDVLVLWNFWTSMEKTYYAKRHEHLQYIAWGKDCIQAWNMELLDK